jgi:Mg2+ and Co2+ transporter CorA
VRGARKEISIARNKCEVKYSKDLNRSIERLTYIMAYLTIITVVISVPNTVATIYGIAPFAVAVEPWLIWLLIVATTAVSIVVSYYFIRKWNI